MGQYNKDNSPENQAHQHFISINFTTCNRCKPTSKPVNHISSIILNILLINSIYTIYNRILPFKNSNTNYNLIHIIRVCLTCDWGSGEGKDGYICIGKSQIIVSMVNILGACHDWLFSDMANTPAWVVTNSKCSLQRSDTITNNTIKIWWFCF